jgi:hypothetical protein
MLFKADPKEAEQRGLYRLQQQDETLQQVDGEQLRLRGAKV